jgi:hypothetical protein
MWCNYQPKHFASAPTEASNAGHSIGSGAVGQQKVIVVMIPIQCWHDRCVDLDDCTVPKVFQRARHGDLLATRVRGYATKMTVITDRNRPVDPWYM